MKQQKIKERLLRLEKKVKKIEKQPILSAVDFKFKPELIPTGIMEDTIAFENTASGYICYIGEIPITSNLVNAYEKGLNIELANKLIITNSLVIQLYDLLKTLNK